MHQTWLIADLHLNHYNIINYTNRPFSTVEEMNLALINNWNSVVGKFDHIMVLGDFAFGDCAHFVEQLKGYKILIMGNHDRRKTIGHWLRMGFDEVYKRPMIIYPYIMSHEPLWYNTGSLYNICAHKHQLGINDLRHFFVSVELINYTPINLKAIDQYFNITEKGEKK
jgi:calcineurin-like phosphoesterase family protein